MTGNIVFTVAVKQSASVRSPSFILLANLAVSDIKIGLLRQPIYVLSLSAVSQNDFLVKNHCYNRIWFCYTSDYQLN